MVDHLDEKTTHNLDLRDTIHPVSLLKVKKTFQKIRAGDALEILIGDPETRVDLFKVLSDITYDLLRLEKIEAENSFYRIKLEKKKS
jgi:TusA-related sulfurtransferase